MDKKQCERMFEQMQPPEAVVQRLQQRIHAEEAASLAEQQPNRSIQTLHTTTAPPPPKRIRCSWQKLSGGVVAAVFLLSMGTVIGYHLKHGEQVFVPSSESTPEASETPKATQSLVLQYQGQNLQEMAVVNPDKVEVQDMLGEGSLMGADGATTVSVCQVYLKDTATIEESVVAAEWNGTQYLFVSVPDIVRTFKDYPIIENWISSGSFTFLDEDQITERTYENYTNEELFPLFTFLQDNADSINFSSGLSSDADVAEENVQMTDRFTWDYAITISSDCLDLSGVLYFDVGDGVWKMDLLDRQAYFLSTPEILTEMLSEVAASHAVVPNTQNGNASENSTSATGELLGRTAIDGSNPKNTTIQDLQPQLLNQPFSFRQVSGSLVDSYTGMSSDGTGAIEEIRSLTTFQIDLATRTKDVLRIVASPPDSQSDSREAATWEYIYANQQKLSMEQVWTANNWYTIYPDLQCYTVLNAGTDEWTNYDTAVNMLADGTIFEDGIFYLGQEFSARSEDLEGVVVPQNLFVFGTVSYLNRDCYLVGKYEDGSITRYLIDMEQWIALKRETVGADFQKIDYFKEILFDEAATPVPEVEESSLTAGMQYLP